VRTVGAITNGFADVAFYLTNGVTAKTEFECTRWTWQWWIELAV